MGAALAITRVPLNPIEDDALAVLAGMVAQRSADRQIDLAAALGCTVSQACRYGTG